MKSRFNNRRITELFHERSGFGSAGCMFLVRRAKNLQMRFISRSVDADSKKSPRKRVAPCSAALRNKIYRNIYVLSVFRVVEYGKYCLAFRRELIRDNVHYISPRWNACAKTEDNRSQSSRNGDFT